MIAFSFLVVTVIMLTNFRSDYWRTTLYLLIFKHVADFMAYTIDLTSFSRRNLNCMKCKFILDAISIILSVGF